jgi:cobalt/nickel transport system permease protein
MVRSLQHYHRFSLALASRGFNGNFQVYSNPSYRYSRRYAIESLIGCAVLVFLEFRI